MSGEDVIVLILQNAETEVIGVGDINAVIKE
jgi:hypothetical protein